LQERGAKNKIPSTHNPTKKPKIKQPTTKSKKGYIGQTPNLGPTLGGVAQYGPPIRQTGLGRLGGSRAKGGGYNEVFNQGERPHKKKNKGGVLAKMKIQNSNKKRRTVPKNPPRVT